MADSPVQPDVSGPFGLECDACGESVFRRDADRYSDGEEDYCPGCGARVVVNIDNGPVDEEDWSANAFVYEHGGEVVTRLRAEVKRLTAALADEEGAHAMTAANFEGYVEDAEARLAERPSRVRGRLTPGRTATGEIALWCLALWSGRPDPSEWEYGDGTPFDMGAAVADAHAAFTSLRDVVDRLTRERDALLARVAEAKRPCEEVETTPTVPGLYWRRIRGLDDRAWSWAPAEVYRGPDGQLMTNGYSIDGLAWGPRLVPPQEPDTEPTP
jgi:hypothetical protein